MKIYQSALALVSVLAPVSGFVQSHNSTPGAVGDLSRNTPKVQSFGYANASTEKNLFGALIGGKASFYAKKRIKKRIKKSILNKVKKVIVKKLLGFARHTVEDIAIDKLLDSMDLSESSRAVMDELDELHTTFIVYALPPSIKATESWTNKDFETEGRDGEERFDLGWERTGEGYHDWKKGFIPAEIVEISENVEIKRIRVDSLFEKTAIEQVQGDLKGEVLVNNNILPLTDSIFQFESKEQADELIKDLGLQGKSEDGCSPEPYKGSDWGDKTSDEHLFRFFFHGIAASLLERQTAESSMPELGPFEIDLDFMSELPVRDGFRPYGAKIFANTKEITAIYDSAKGKLYKPGDEGWEGAKFVAKSSAFVLNTAREHLSCSHMVVANYLSLAKVKFLSPDHPIQRIVNVFTFRTNSVNDSAFTTLMPEFSILHRGTGFEYEGFRGVFDNSFETSNAFQPFPTRNMRPELLEMSENGKLPYHSEANEYYAIVEEFVKAWLEEAGDAATDEQAQQFYNEIRENAKGQRYEIPEFKDVSSMVDLLTQAFFTVTCYHEIIGTVIDHTNDIYAMANRLVEDEEGNVVTSADVQSYLLTMAITASTGIATPMLMKPYKNYFSHDGAPRWEKKEWKSFVKALEKQSRKIKKDIKNRKNNGDVEFLYFDPEQFESAVSV